jgi:hypothetical protein
VKCCPPLVTRLLHESNPEPDKGRSTLCLHAALVQIGMPKHSKNTERRLGFRPSGNFPPVPEALYGLPGPAASANRTITVTKAIRLKMWQNGNASSGSAVDVAVTGHPFATDVAGKTLLRDKGKCRASSAALEDAYGEGWRRLGWGNKEQGDKDAYRGAWNRV